MIYGIIIFEFLLQIFLNVYYQKVLKIPILHFLKSTFLSYVITLCFLFLIIYNLKKYFLVESWFSFLIQATSYSILFGVTVYYFVFSMKEKQLIKSLISFKKNM